ncbi:MAG TPA: GDSL-type esterase/lipase family protein [Solirubrobacterales bacterium]|nr:GDSL-type esterase/lipase family protein [Solirubrobacterales bacterium]
MPPENAPRKPARDDSLMQRFDEQRLRRFSARDAVLATALIAFLLLIFSGGSVKRAGEELNPGVGRDVVLAVGKPAAWVAEQLPFAQIGHTLTGWLSPDQKLVGLGFEEGSATGAGAAAGKGPSPVTPEWFDGRELGEEAPRPKLTKLLVTGDSLSTPLDIELGQRLTPDGVEVIREPHLATGISRSDVVDWGKLSATQVAEDHPQAVVIFIGANEGLPMPGPGGEEVSCCGPEWAAIWANRARQMMENYIQGGRAKLYWLTVPAARDPARKPIVDAVNAAVDAAAAPFRSSVRVVDMNSVFTPGDEFRDAMEIDGQETIVREPDGIHLNKEGSALAAEIVEEELDRDFTP